MDFDFVTLYENYNSIELLKILLHPDQYQEEAVQAATDILAGRNVTDDERRAAGYIIHEPAADDAGISINTYPPVTTDMLESFNTNDQGRSAFFTTVFIIISVYYLHPFYLSARDIFYGFKYGTPPFILILIDAVYLLLIPFALLRLYQRKKAGWFILFAESILTFAPMVYYSLGTFRHIFSQLSVLSVLDLLEIVMKPLVIFFLWEKTTAEYAGVSLQQKKTTLIVCVITVIVLSWFVHMMNSGKSF